MPKSISLLIGSLIGIVCLVGIYYGAQYYQNLITGSNEGILNDGASTRDTSAASDSLENSTNWSKYENSTYKYSIKYPSNASLSYFDTAGNEIKSESNKAGCAKITYDSGSIIVSADSKPNYCIIASKPKGYSTLKDVINIKGVAYETTGYFEESANSLNQILNLEYSDEIFIQYSISTPKDTDIDFDKAKSVIEMSLKTFIKS
ncbi:hypothetical protein A2215_04065 [Candidatus Berkelbacteria bacterium RIFOXYA2_FULL_43_10]|uniref:Uncharacterized protein n=1 Tax=Candidatus Berkelbacteria bacterium RIFOXYA2_FULL_43_10 TaxID=1797472 RepID=A0A1F5EEZ9_9BACT|nr:MAG: hypothetical protein A2215_04065 [Candidatus Berkelbacteria bacterium RIFOXYA2_FULL_43_10]